MSPSGSADLLSERNQATMSTLRRSLAAASLLVLAPVMTACGFSEQTDAVYQSSTGVNSRTGNVWILNAMVVTGTDGEGTFAGTLVNQNENASAQLVSVSDSTNNAAVVVPAGSAVNLATSGQVRVSDSSITPGSYLELTFQFADGQTTQLNVPVLANTGDYGDVPVGPVTKKQATPSASASATAG